MSSREPMWYCHECNAEMRALMVPDPHCASCNGTFVEKMENPADDPREFHRAAHPTDAAGLGPLEFITSLQELLRPDHPSPARPIRSQSPIVNRNASPTSRSPMGLRFEMGGPSIRHSYIIGGNNTLDRERREGSTVGSSPRFLEHLRASGTAGAGGPQDARIPGHLMAQYLLSLISGGTMASRGDPLLGPFGMGLPGGGGENGAGGGRWGDYVFTQDALDQIITQMMEGANSNRPVPATEEILKDLPREVLMEGSPLLEKDCAICKDQFSVEADDPDNQVVVTLPCKHPFHEACIMPWLNSSGTCPVCRHALVPQPNNHTDGPGRPNPSTSPGSRSPHRSPGSPGSSPQTQNLFHSFFGNYVSGRSDAGGSSSGRTRSSSDPSHRSGGSNSGGGNGQHFPGGWGDSLD